MKWLTGLFLGRPLAILAVAAAFALLAAVAATNWTAIPKRPRPLWIAAGAWALYAAWEWLVLKRSPDANIRFDLLMIWPILAGVSVWGLLASLRSSLR